jgi:hypothetical protein
LEKPAENKTIKGFHQGAIISDEATIDTILKSTGGYVDLTLAKPKLLFVLTQDCDILRDAEKEPFIDFLAGDYAAAKNGNLSKGKNPRSLQIEFEGNIVEFHIHDYFRIKKEIVALLDIHFSASSFDAEAARLIVRWISRRFTRAAFPDAFNARLQGIERLTKNSLMELVSLIYVDVSDAELPDTVDYTISIIIGVSHGEDSSTLKSIEGFFGKEFNFNGIISDIRVVDEYDITYEILSTYKRFDWDYRSLPENVGAAAPATGTDSF